MRIITTATGFALTAALFLHASSAFAGGADEKTERQFSHVIEYESGASGFAEGDRITITAVRGDREHIEPGGSYLVEGTYTLSSANTAKLALFCTTRGPSGPTPVQDEQQIKITKGSGKFYLYETNVADGWLHVSFYPDNSSWHGGVYFGEKGKENTIMRKQSWFEKPAAGAMGKQQGSAMGSISGQNRVLLAYLGSPVPTPADMDAKYTKEGLSSAVELAARKAGIKLKKVMIDDSEFPFLVGIICEGPEFPKLKAQLNKMDGYEYGGGTGNDTRFAGCIVPHEAFPAEAWQQISHRRMLRTQVFFDKLEAQE